MTYPGLAAPRGLAADWVVVVGGVLGGPAYQICWRLVGKSGQYDSEAKTVGYQHVCEGKGDGQPLFALTVSCNAAPLYKREAAVDRIRPQD